MGTKLVSFDTSTTHTGMAVFEDGKLIRVEELIAPPCLTDWHDRVNYMGQLIMERVKAEKPDEIAVESMVVRTDPLVFKMLTQMVGIVKSAAVEVDAEFYAYTPPQWRKYCRPECEITPGKLVGHQYRREEWKKWSLERVNRLYCKTDSDDVADAVLVGVAHLNFIRQHQT